MITRWRLRRFAAELGRAGIVIIPGTTGIRREPGWRPRYTVGWVQAKNGVKVSRSVTVWWWGHAMQVLGWITAIAGPFATGGVVRSGGPVVLGEGEQVVKP